MCVCVCVYIFDVMIFRIDVYIFGCRCGAEAAADTKDVNVMYIDGCCVLRRLMTPNM